MKLRVIFPVILSVGLFAGCSTPSSRIEKHQSEFATWPADVQQKVRAGRVDIGFTPEMVRVALGEPSRHYTRTTAQGVQEIWSYPEKGPKFSIGLGLGSVHGNTAMGGGVAVGDAFRDDEAMRVVFDQGRVAAIETRR